MILVRSWSIRSIPIDHPQTVSSALGRQPPATESTKALQGLAITNQLQTRNRRGESGDRERRMKEEECFPVTKDGNHVIVERGEFCQAVRLHDRR
jgi:hypothetical protein